MPTETLPTEPLALNEADASRVIGLSAKSLKRLADPGEAVGKVRAGRRVLYRYDHDVDALGRSVDALMMPRPGPAWASSFVGDHLASTIACSAVSFSR